MYVCELASHSIGCCLHLYHLSHRVGRLIMDYVSVCVCVCKLASHSTGHLLPLQQLPDRVSRLLMDPASVSSSTSNSSLTGWVDLLWTMRLWAPPPPTPLSQGG